MWDFNLRDTFAAMVKTMPFILIRIAVYFGIAILYILATGVGGGLGYGVTSFAEEKGWGTLYGAFIGFGGASGFLYWAREYILYLIKAGHIAVLVHNYDDKDLPSGRGQIDYGRQEVQSRFAQASLLFGLDQLIKGVLRVISGTINTVANFIPIPGLHGLIKMVSAVIRASLTYVDEIIIAYLIRTESENPWQSSRDALVLYAQNYKSMLKNAVWLSLFMWLLTVVLFIVLLPVVVSIAAVFPAETSVWPVLIALVLAWSCKQAIIEPIAIYALMQVFFKKIEGQEPDPEWVERLDKTSSKFRDLAQKAKNVITGSSPKASKPDGLETSWDETQ